MNPDEINNYQGHPAVLDKLAFDDGDGYLMGLFGLGAELYVAPRSRMPLCEDMIAAMEDYYRLFPDKLDRCLIPDPEDDGRFVKIKEFPKEKFLDAMGRWPDDRSFSVTIEHIHTHPGYPSNAGTVTPYAASYLVSQESDNELSYFQCYMPVGAGGDRLNFGVLRDALLRWCDMLQPAHGAAGYCVILEIPRDTGGKYAYTHMRRHPGLDFFDPLDFSLEVESVHNRIKSVNWLTVLGDAVLAELGGLQAAKSALEPECTIHQYDGGIVIQAGEIPVLGDTHQEDIPELYRRVARFTKPVRFGSYSASLFRVFEPMDGATEAKRWVARFD